MQKLPELRKQMLALRDVGLLTDDVLVNFNLEEFEQQCKSIVFSADGVGFQAVVIKVISNMLSERSS